MMKVNLLRVACRELENGGFQFIGSDSDGVPIHPLGVRNRLFFWHEPSYYGTTLEIVEIDGTEGVVLPASYALDFWASDRTMSLIPTEWDETANRYKRMAAFLQKAAAAGHFAPSFEKMSMGRFGWKLLPWDDESQREYMEICNIPSGHNRVTLDGWFDSLMAHWTGGQEEAAAAWAELAAVHPAVAVAATGGDYGSVIAGSPASTNETSGSDLSDAARDAAASAVTLFADEEEWLVAIGWKTDECPFRIGLELQEPQEDAEGWRLCLVLADKNDPAIRTICSQDGAPLSGHMPDAWQTYAAPRLSRSLDKLLRLLPALRDDRPEAGVREWLDDEEAWTFMERDSLLLLEAGFSVFLPAWWEDIRKLKPRLKAKVRSSVGASGEPLFGMNQLVQFDWRVALGGLDLTEAEFKEAAETHKRLVRVRGRWVHLDPALLADIRKSMGAVGKKGLTFRDMLALYLTGNGDDEPAVTGNGAADGDAAASNDHQLRLEVELNEHLNGLVRRLQETKTIPTIDAPAGLNGTLRHYQQAGVSWLAFLRSFGLGGILADDMGLGKTIQFIAYLLHIKHTEQPGSPALLVTPTSVLGNWQKELERFAPELDIRLHYGSQRAKGEAFPAWIHGADLVLTSYTLTHLDESELASVNWHAVCLDEAQNIKNAYTKQSGAIRRLNAGHRIAMTGTPIENRLTELWSLFDFITPRYLGSLNDFSKQYVNEIERTRDPALIGQVQRLVKPFLLRRVKQDPSIQLDLPDKNENKTYIPLTVEQGTGYDAAVQELLNGIEQRSGIERKGLVLAALTKLKQICNHPALYGKETVNLRSSEDRQAFQERSNKVARLVEMVQELRSQGDKGLVFTQYVDMGQMLAALLEQELGEHVPFLHGGVAKTGRDRMIDRFQKDPSYGIFVLSLKAGGTGLNLTAANHVFHFDRWWNPAVENQATDRAFRIGQTKDVQVHKFITIGTLEERIDEMIERKQGLTRQIVGTGENWITELSVQELRELFSLRRAWG